MSEPQAAPDVDLPAAPIPLQIKLPEPLHRVFKAVCGLESRSMAGKVPELIERWVRDRYPDLANENLGPAGESDVSPSGEAT